MYPRFLNKIFTAKEQDLIFNSKIPVVQVWILWAMKEAAYKAHQRIFHLPRKFAPLQIECEIWQQDIYTANGNICIENSSYHSNLSINQDYLYCTASTLPQEKIFSGIYSGSRCSKRDLILKFSALVNKPVDQIKIIKDRHQVPHFSINNKSKYHPFSLSHHGNFSAFSLALMNY